MIVTIPVKAACLTTFQRTATCCSKFERLSINLFRSAQFFFLSSEKARCTEVKEEGENPETRQRKFKMGRGMVNSRLCEKARITFFFESPRQFDPGRYSQKNWVGMYDQNLWYSLSLFMNWPKNRNPTCIYGLNLSSKSCFRLAL